MAMITPFSPSRHPTVVHRNEQNGTLKENEMNRPIQGNSGSRPYRPGQEGTRVVVSRFPVSFAYLIKHTFNISFSKLADDKIDLKVEMIQNWIRLYRAYTKAKI